MVIGVIVPPILNVPLNLPVTYTSPPVCETAMELPTEPSVVPVPPKYFRKSGVSVLLYLAKKALPRGKPKAKRP